MDDSVRDQSEAVLGKIEMLPDPAPPSIALEGRPLQGTIYQWTPSSLIANQLPPFFVLRLRCIILGDGARRFYPVDGVDNFILRDAFQAGLAVLSAISELTPEQRQSYRFMFLLFQNVGRTREHLGNNMLNVTSLLVGRVGRDLQADETNILPATVGLDVHGRGETWTVDRLVTEGERAAREAGITHPTEADRIRYGLHAAAQMNPLCVPADKVPQLLRQALFADIDGEGPLEAEVIEAVTERMITAIQQHLTEPAADFSKWFTGGNNSLIAQIARRKLLPGGRLDPNLVRRVRLDLGWKAYQYMGDCIHAAMRQFELAIPEPLTDFERTLFHRMYFKQADFGNLPLMLLHDRFPFFKPSITDLLEKPGDSQATGVLYRLLDWFGEMARERREVDRRVKQRRPADLQQDEKTPLTVSLPVVADGEGNEDQQHVEVASGEPAAPEANEMSQLFLDFVDIVDHICRRQQLRCPCGSQSWHHRPIAQDGITVKVEHTCVKCSATTHTQIPVERIRQIAADSDK